MILPMPDTNSKTPLFSDIARTTLDEKLRVTIPARWRASAEGGEEFFLSVNRTGTCVRVMPPHIFTSTVDKLTNNPAVSNTELAKFKRMYFAKSRHVVTDKAGRIQVPADYATTAGIKKDVVLVGAGDTFEIHSTSAWDRTQDEDQSTFDRLSDMAGV